MEHAQFVKYATGNYVIHLLTNLMPGQESFITKHPQSSSLRKYIAYYYFHRKDEGASSKFIYYPHIRCGLTIYKDSDVILDNHSSTTVPDKSVAYKMMYGGVEKQAWHVEMKPPFNKICTAFQPLGINHFIHKDLETLLTDRNEKDFEAFLPEITTVLDAVYDTEDIDKKVSLLDAFYQSCFTPFKETRLATAVDLLLKSDRKFNVQDLSEATSMSRKTLYRLFKAHLNCSVKEYINVVQFRKAVAAYQEAMQKPQFNNLAYANNYYDQSEFIRHFKKITGFNPKQFFKNLQQLGTEDTFWTLAKSGLS